MRLKKLKKVCLFKIKLKIERKSEVLKGLGEAKEDAEIEEEVQEVDI